MGHVSTRRRLYSVMGIVAISLGLHGMAHAAGYPDRAITLVVPYAAGATTDLLGRTVGQHMAKSLGQPVVVENRAGANGIIGTAHVARAQPDGHTLLLSTDSSTVLNELLYSSLPYSPKDLKPVALLSDLPIVLVVSSALPVNSLQEFVDYAKANPGKLNYGSTGKGGTFHLAAELFSQQAGIEMTHVPYKGGSPGVTALMANEIQAWFGVVGSTLSQVRSGQIKALALASPERLAALPDTPTFRESGFPDYEVLVRYGLAVPAGTPDAVVQRLAESTHLALQDAAFRKLFSELGFVLPESTGPDHYQGLIAGDRELWSGLIRTQGISLD